MNSFMLLQGYDILEEDHYKSYSNFKASVVERYNKSIEQLIYKHFTSRGTYKWVDVWPEKVKFYNSRYHKTIKMMPKEVTDSSLMKTIYNNVKVIDERKPTFKVSNLKRISRQKGAFETNDIISIRQTHPRVYCLESYGIEPIKGGSYEHELKKASSPNEYLLDKSLKEIKTCPWSHGGVSQKHMTPWLSIKTLSLSLSRSENLCEHILVSGITFPDDPLSPLSMPSHAAFSTRNIDKPCINIVGARRDFLLYIRIVTCQVEIENAAPTTRVRREVFSFFFSAHPKSGRRTERSRPQWTSAGRKLFLETSDVESFINIYVSSPRLASRTEVNVEQRPNARVGETGDPSENPPTSGLVRHISHVVKLRGNDNNSSPIAGQLLPVASGSVQRFPVSKYRGAGRRRYMRKYFATLPPPTAGIGAYWKRIIQSDESRISSVFTGMILEVEVSAASRKSSMKTAWEKIAGAECGCSYFPLAHVARLRFTWLQVGVALVALQLALIARSFSMSRDGDNTAAKSILRSPFQQKKGESVITVQRDFPQQYDTAPPTAQMI
ncbi:hypothetical protein PR048_027736 [Dryococelus australis]|uniref:Integrase catalytic domain-containing protein n=1 Tax=Dryococelus australis TaxID=614101 RepID=A0ABQ9GHE2_9NEOP|nr:hypothetical protein PR048_027736 [Dryococelus australis]